MKTERRGYGVRLAVASLAVLAAWWPVSSAYAWALRWALNAATGVRGHATLMGTLLVTPWLLPALAIIAASRTSARRRVIGVCLALLASWIVDCTVLLSAVRFAVSPAAQIIASRTAQQVLPFAVVLVFSRGRPQSLWRS